MAAELARRAVRETGVDVTVSSARVETVAGTAVEVWETDEPSAHGIEGVERVRLVRDDIAGRVEDLLARLRDGDTTTGTR
ncbi:hypothetical protein AB2L27_08510 [Kineococcus sp. LSe6-4]|uniref:Uncharacterized protein n=1 Tax=Kineococcus halophytocola TaxID=3234027 RepID=A0ABV4GZS0_9ACTN